jgi:hypothetical protein
LIPAGKIKEVKTVERAKAIGETAAEMEVLDLEKTVW